MRALVARSRGGPDVLAVEEVEDRVAGEGQVLIQVRSAGINFSDIMAVAGHYATAPAPPWTPGHEVAGTDAATGEPVIAYLASGGYAERAVAERGFTFPAGDLDLDTAGGCVLVSIAALVSLREAARLHEGDTLLVTAAAGGIGSAAIQAGRLLGAGRIVAVASTPEKRAFALELGADEAIGYDDDVPPIDVLFDTVGDAEGHERRIEAVRQLGRIMLMGSSSGKEAPLPEASWLKARNIIASVFSWGALRRGDPDTAKRLATEISGLIRDGGLRPPVRETVALEDVADAYERILARETMGKLVLRPGA
ncbi:MAG TPA: zinc-binding dehydrogenase [Gaiellaceae bacterium]|jgi:NADPH2:quinone reductase|nr:zinc-binding dehydrogenase [Gaiellaceae bacterium]